MRISICPASSRLSTAGSLAIASARPGRPSARSQSAIIGRYSALATHPPGGLELRQRILEVTGRVGRLAARLADDRDPGGSCPSCDGVLVGGLRVGVDQPAAATRCRATRSGELLGQRLQLVGDEPVELLTGDVLGDRRPVVRRWTSVRSVAGRSSRRYRPAVLLGRAGRSSPRPRSARNAALGRNLALARNAAPARNLASGRLPAGIPWKSLTGPADLATGWTCQLSPRATPVDRLSATGSRVTRPTLTIAMTLLLPAPTVGRGLTLEFGWLNLADRTILAKDEVRAALKAARTEECPATSYSPTRSRMQYHRR